MDKCYPQLDLQNNYSKSAQHSFFKVYFIDYAITVVPIFPLLSSSTQYHNPTPLDNPHIIIYVHGSCI